MDVEKYTPMLIPLAKSGKIREIGVSNHSLAEIKRVNNILSAAGLKVKKIGETHGISVAQVATTWAIAKGTLPIIGVTKVHHVLDALKSISVVLTKGEIMLMEKTADELGLSTIRYWEKKME